MFMISGFALWSIVKEIDDWSILQYVVLGLSVEHALDKVKS